MVETLWCSCQLIQICSWFPLLEGECLHHPAYMLSLTHSFSALDAERTRSRWFRATYLRPKILRLPEFSPARRQPFQTDSCCLNFLVLSTDQSFVVTSHRRSISEACKEFQYSHFVFACSDLSYFITWLVQASLRGLWTIRLDRPSRSFFAWVLSL